MLKAEKTPAPHDRVHPLISNGTRSLVDKLSKMLLRQSPEQHGKNFICPFLALAEQALHSHSNTFALQNGLSKAAYNRILCSLCRQKRHKESNTIATIIIASRECHTHMYMQ
jgi:hypothetical protein